MKIFFTKSIGLVAFFLLSLIQLAEVNGQCATAAAATRSHTDISCFGANDGSITVEITDGTGPFQFDLFDNNVGTFVTLAVTENQLGDGRTVIYTDVYPGSFQVVVFKSGCPPIQITDGFTGFLIDEPTAIVASVNTVTNDCDNLGSGAIDISVSGGTPPYTFNWSNGETTEDVSALAAGTYSVDILDANSCPITLSGIIVESGPNAGMFNGTAGEVCTTDPPFNLFTLLDGSQDAGGAWSTLSGVGASVNASSGEVNFTAATAGTFTFRYTASVPSCTDDTEDVTVNVTAAANAGVYLGTAGEVCTTDTAFDLTTLLDGSQDGGGTWSDTNGSGATITTNNANFTGVSAGTYTFTYTVTGTAPCGDDSEVVTVNVNAAPNAGAFIGTAGEACTTDIAFDLFALLNGTEDGGGSWAVTSGVGAVLNAASGAVDFSAATAGVFTFEYTVAGAGSCVDDVESVTVNLTAAANAGNYVGTAGEVCTSDTAFDLTTLLNGSQDGGGTWSDTNGSGATITANDANFTGVSAGTYTFTYTVTSTAPCGDDSEVVTVNVNAAPNAGAFIGTAGEACTTDIAFDLFALLNGTEDGGGSWAVTSGVGAVLNAASGAVDFSAATAGVFTFEYTVAGAGSCVDDVESVTVNLTTAANAGNYVGTAGEVCTSDTAFDLTTLLDGSQDGGGTWSDTNGSGATITANDANFTGVSAGTYTFTYTVTGTAPCGDDSEVVTVNVNAAPNAGAFIGTAGEACTTDIAFDLFALLNGTEDGGGSWAVTSGVGSVVNAGSGAVDFSAATAGVFTYEYTVAGAGSCVDDVESVTVNLTAAANAGNYVGTAGEVCTTDTAFDLTTLLDGSQDGGGTWSDTNGSGATITANDANFTGVSAGTYTFTYTVPGTAPCGDDSEVVTVNVNAAPNAGAFIGTAGEACTTDIAFDLFALLNGTEDGGGSWAVTNGVGSVVNAASGAVDFSAATAGVFTYEYTVAGAGSCVDDVESVTVNLTTAANAGNYVGTAGEVCTTDTAFDLTTLLDGSQDGGGTWSDTNGSGATITANDANFTGVSAGTYTFTYTVPGTAPCGDDSEVVTVNVNAAPNAGAFIGTAGEACTTDIAFDLFALLNGTEDGGGSWAVTNGVGSVVNAASGAVDFSAATAGVFTYEYTVAGAGSCVDDVESVTVNLTTAANAGNYVGTAGEVCTTDTAFDLTTLLDGSQDGGGTWSDTNGSGATITANDANFTGVSAGTYTFTYTVPGTAPCGDDSEVVTVNVNAAPNAGAFIGTAGEACTTETAFDLTTLLDGSQDGGGTWSDTDGSGATIMANDANFTGVAAGTYTFTYTVTGSGSCVDDTEVVTLNLTAGPTAEAGSDSTLCDATTFDLSTLTTPPSAMNGTITWSTASVDGSFDDATIEQPIYTFGTDELASGTAELFLTVTGAAGCDAAIDTVVFAIGASPIFNTPLADQSTCYGETPTITADVSGGAGLTWTTIPDTGRGTFSAANAATTDYVPVEADSIAGSVQLVLTVAGSGACNAVSDTLTLIINSIRVEANTITNSTGCGVADGAIDITVTSNAAGDTFAFAWTGPSGFTASVEDIAGLEGGTYNVTTTSDLTGCVTSASFNIVDPVPFTLANFTLINQTQCGADDGSVTFDVAGGTGPFNYYIVDTNAAMEVIGSRSDADASATYNFASLAPGDYEVFVEDGTCTLGTTFTIDPVMEITATVSGTTLATCGAADGSITLDVTDVGNDFEVTTDDGINTPTTTTETAGTTTVTINGLALGTYTITVRDVVTNCSLALNQAISEDAPFTVDSETVTDISTCGGSDGAIDLDISGLSGAETYTWTGPTGFTDPGTQDLSGLSIAGAYEVTIEDAGCTVVRSYNLSAPAQPTAGTGSSGVVGLGDNPFDLFTLLSGNDAGGVWTLDGGATLPVVDATTGIADFTGTASGIYTFTYTITTIPTCTDAATVTVDFRSFDCANTKFSIITEEATCSGVQDGLVFLFLQQVSNADSLKAVINGTDTLTFVNPGNGSLVELDTIFFSGNYDITLYDAILGCDSTKTILIGEKQSIIPSLDKTDPTCDNPEGQIQVSLTGTFDFVLLDASDAEIDRNSTGVFANLVPATYGVAFENTGSQICKVDTLKNIILNVPTAVSNGTLDVTVVEPTCNTNTAQVIVNFGLTGTFAYQILDENDVEVTADTTDLGTVTFDLDTTGVFDLVVSNQDNPGICEPNRRSFSILRSGGFTAIASNKQDVVCFGDSTGSVIITLNGIASGFYSFDSGISWIEFTSGNVLNGLPATNNILVSDQPGTSACEISVVVDIMHLSQPIALGGAITLVTQASCTAAEAIGEINIPVISGGVAPYTLSIDGTPVTLDASRNIGGLARNVSNLLITDAIGCSETFEIGSIVSPNEVRLVDNAIKEINPGENCLLQPEGIILEIGQNTLDNVSGPFNLIINKVDETEVFEFTLDVDASGSPVFQIGPGLDFEFDFEKGARYRWTVRSVANEQACSADGFINITAGAIVPSFELQGIDAQCFGQSGAISLTNIVADTGLPLVIQLFNDRDDLIRTFVQPGIPLSNSFTIDPSTFGFLETGTYNIRLLQKPVGCVDSIPSEYLPTIIDGPTAELFVELIPEPQVPPSVELSRNEMNPMPTTRPDFSDGSISIRLVSPTSATGYSAQIFLVEPLGNNNVALYDLPSDPISFREDNTLTFSNLLPGIYEIEYYDAFGCGTAGNKLVRNTADDGFEITVDFDRSPFIPNIFTPGTNGINDEFEILNLPDNGAELLVTNRTGAIVYRSKNYRLGNLWDGGDLPDGVYFYQLTIDNKTYNGWVELLRDNGSR